MFAIVKTGGKQYKVQANDVLQIEKIEGEAGETIILNDILLIDDGKSVKTSEKDVAGFGVAAEVVEQKKDDKIIVFKKKRRQNYRRKNGHRQEISIVKITEIGKDLKPAKATAKKEATKKSAPKAEKKAAAPKKETSAKPAAKKSTTTKKASAKK